MTNITPTPTVPRGRLLGIDHGGKIIGLAVCDPNWIVVRPFEVMKRKDRTADFAHIDDIIKKQQITAVVVGLPELPVTPESGSTIKNQADTVRRWASRLAAVVGVPVYFWEEQYSTFAAEELARETGEKFDPRERLDDHAAAVILRSFMDAHPIGTPLPKPIKQR